MYAKDMHENHVNSWQLGSVRLHNEPGQYAEQLTVFKIV